jgi:SET domain-containing protein
LFNHSTLHQNVGWTRDVENRLITYTTLRNIRRGEELCISYGDRLTFIDADARILQDRLEEDEDMLAAIQIT